MNPVIAAAITELEHEHARIGMALSALRGLTPGIPTAEPPRKPNAQAKAKAAPANGHAKEWHAKADQLLAAGKSVKEVAAACGVSEAGIYYHRSAKKNGKPKAKASGDAPHFRCQECGQHGVNPKACDHCGEKR
jgi:hypothetical protein